MWLTKVSPANRLLDLLNGSTPESFFEVPVEIVEKKEAFEITAEVPGLSKDELSITVENGILTIAGEKKNERHEEHKDNRYHYFERRYGKFSRSFELGESVRSEKIDASCKDGVLKLVVGKREEVQPKAVEVKWV